MTTSRSGGGRLDDLLAELWRLGGTDLHLRAGSPAWVRVDGRLTELDDGPLDEAVLRGLVAEELPQHLLERAEVERSVDCSFGWRSLARVRANVFFEQGRLALALRVIPLRVPLLDELGVPDSVRALTMLDRGLVLMTGPTGSGKSTTLAAMVDAMNTSRAVHVLTLEDPIEFVHTSRRSLVSQREVGVDVPSFEAALRSAVREDPDVLLVGEMRDVESIQIALTLAETGHLVLATLHTNDAAQAVDRIVDVFPAERQGQIRVQLAATLQAVVAQRLLPRCGGGLAPAFEVLLGTGAVRNLVREGKSAQLHNVELMSQAAGMQSLERSLADLVLDGVVERSAAFALSAYPEELERLLVAAEPLSAAALR